MSQVTSVVYHAEQVWINGQAPAYDQNFNLYTLDGWRYDYDAAKQLLLTTNGTHTGEFVYDGLGRCVKRRINGITTVITYDGWKPTVEWNVQGNLAALNLYGLGPDEILYRYDSSHGERFRYHLDRMGNVAFLLDWHGHGLEKYTYDAFGRPQISDQWNNPRYDARGRFASWYGNRFLHAGREWITELGLYDYRHRMYHPGLGRFLQTDPSGFDGGDMNLFRYCADDPINHTDPMGLEAKSSGDVWRDLMKFYSGNPSMHVVQDAWDQKRAGGVTMATVVKNQGKKSGLQVLYNAYPMEGPGGRRVVARVLEKLRGKPSGRKFFSQNRTLRIAPTGGPYKTGGGRGATSGDAYLFLNPKHPLFYDKDTDDRLMLRYPLERPPETDGGRASVIAHELGHALFGARDEPKGNNVRDFENPVRDDFEIQRRGSYYGHDID